MNLTEDSALKFEYGAKPLPEPGDKECLVRVIACAKTDAEAIAALNAPAPVPKTCSRPTWKQVYCGGSVCQLSPRASAKDAGYNFYIRGGLVRYSEMDNETGWREEDIT